MLYILIGMSIFFVLMVVWAFRQDKKEKEKLKNYKKGIDKSRKICYNKYVR
jgi:preprotein translocase subunit YajC